MQTGKSFRVALSLFAYLPKSDARYARAASWAYVGFLYHFTPEVAIGINAAYAQWWSKSDTIKNIPGTQNCIEDNSAPIPCSASQYVTTQRAFIPGVLAQMSFDLTPLD